MTIKEGTISFTFPATWYAVKYDDTAFYRRRLLRTGSELTAVDFLVKVVDADRRESILMIEVKDFRGHGVENRKRQTSGDLASEIIDKVLHTLLGTLIGANSNDDELKPFKAAISSSPVKFEAVFLMEEDIPGARIHLQNQKSAFDNLNLKISGKLKKVGISFRLLNSSLIRQQDQWSATV